MAINVHKLRVSNMTVGPLSGGGNGGGGSIVATGLLAHWDMGNSSSYTGGNTITDLTGNGYNAFNAYNNISSAVQGSGASTYITSPNSTFYIQSDEKDVYGVNTFNMNGTVPTFTYSTWFRYGSKPNGIPFDSNFFGINLATSGGDAGRLDAFVSTDSGYQGSTLMSNFTSLYSSTTWVNYAISIDSGAAAFYINGTSIGSSTITGSLITGIKDCINIVKWDQQGMDWAQAAFYNVALSSSQILSNFDALKSRYGY